MNDVTNKMIFDGYRSLSDKLDCHRELIHLSQAKFRELEDELRKINSRVDSCHERITESTLNNCDEEVEDDICDDCQGNDMSAEQIVGQLFDLLDHNHLDYNDVLTNIIGALFALCASKEMNKQEFKLVLMNLLKHYSIYLKQVKKDLEG